MNGRVAVVTGGARGIGYAAVERFLASGAKVAIWDIDAERAKASAEQLAKLGTVSVHAVELTDEAAVQAAAAETLAAHGKIDIAVNNAGITGGNGTTWELDPKVWRDVIEVKSTPSQGNHVETLEFAFPMTDADSARLELRWGTTVVPLSIKAKP